MTPSDVFERRRPPSRWAERLLAASLAILVLAALVVLLWPATPT